MNDNRKEGEVETKSLIKINKPKKEIKRTIREQRLEYEQKQRDDRIEEREKFEDWLYQHPVKSFCCALLFVVVLIVVIVLIVALA